MNDLRTAYEQTRYPAYVHPLTHPSRLAAAAAILGHSAPDPTRARVLDIGCGSGTNLMAMAASLPGASFHGIDFSSPDIASAQALAEESGLGNIEFETADLMSWEPSGTYDYVIAYGLFSWVPDEVKDRLLGLIAEVLAPGGLAAVSYAVYPGAKADEGLRDLLMAGDPKTGDSGERASAAVNVLSLLERAWGRSADTAMATYMAQRASAMRSKTPEYLSLDHLGIVRDPCYLTQFTDWSWEHGLSYLGDADLANCLLASLPAATAAEIAAMALGPIEQTQLVDYITQTTFRTSLLLKGASKAMTGYNPEAIVNLSFRTKLKPVRSTASKSRFKDEFGRDITLTGTIRRIVDYLARHPHEFVPLSQVVAAVEAETGSILGAAEHSQLNIDLLSMVATRLIDVSAQPIRLNETVSVNPQLTPLNRLLARERGLVVSMCHEPVSLTPEQQKLTALLDGSRTLPMIEGAFLKSPISSDVARLVTALTQFGC